MRRHHEAISAISVYYIVAIPGTTGYDIVSLVPACFHPPDLSRDAARAWRAEMSLDQLLCSCSESRCARGTHSLRFTARAPTLAFVWRRGGDGLQPKLRHQAESQAAMNDPFSRTSSSPAPARDSSCTRPKRREESCSRSSCTQSRACIVQGTWHREADTSRPDRVPCAVCRVPCAGTRVHLLWTWWPIVRHIVCHWDHTRKPQHRHRGHSMRCVQSFANGLLIVWRGQSSISIAKSLIRSPWPPCAPCSPAPAGLAS